MAAPRRAVNAWTARTRGRTGIPNGRVARAGGPRYDSALSSERTIGLDPSDEQTLAATEAPTRPVDPERSALSNRLRDALRDPTAPPPKVGRFEILRELGSGGMGSVYAARDPRLDREVAIKLVRAERLSERARIRLEREAQALAQLSHPNVVPVFEVGEHDGQTFLAMELVRGHDLRRWLRAEPRAWPQIVDVYTQAARGLSAAHAAGLVHRDFKPHNALVGRDGRVRVVDFGLATDSAVAAESVAFGEDDPSADVTVSVTRTGGLVGTPAYMSPEQLSGRAVGPASDQFSLCVSLYEALCGRRPHGEGTAPELAARVLREEPAPLPAGDYPVRLGALLRRGLRVDPAERFESMASLIAELELVRRDARPRPRLEIAAAVAGIVIIGLLAWGVGRRTTLRPAVVPPVIAAAPVPPTVADPGPAPAPALPLAPDGEPAQLQDAGQEIEMAQPGFARGSAALAAGDADEAMTELDLAVEPLERAAVMGRSRSRVEHARAMAYVAGYRAHDDDRMLRVAHELLVRLEENFYDNPDPASQQADARRELAVLRADPQRLAHAGISLQPPTRVALTVLATHGRGTEVYAADGFEGDRKLLCVEPCTWGVPVDGDGEIVFFVREGYAEAMSAWNPRSHLNSLPALSPLHRLAPAPARAGPPR